MAILALWVGGGSAVAQDDEERRVRLEGVDIASLGVALPDDAFDKALSLERITIQPDATMPAFTMPGTVLVLVEAGSVVVSVVEGDARGGMQVIRGEAATPVPDDEATLQTEFPVNAGDAIVLDRDVRRTIRNDGQEPAVLLLSGLLDRSEPPFAFDEGTGDVSGTPIAEAIAAGLAPALPNVDEPMPGTGEATPES